MRLVGELTDTEPTEPPHFGRPAVAYYTHGSNLSYTDDGQLIGAGVGAGASSQFLAVDVLTPSGWYGGYFERVRRNHFARLYTLGLPYYRDDAEVTFGFRYVRAFGMLDLGATAALSYRYNRDFYGTETNFHLGVELTLWPPGRKSPVR